MQVNFSTRKCFSFKFLEEVWQFGYGVPSTKRPPANLNGRRDGLAQPEAVNGFLLRFFQRNLEGPYHNCSLSWGVTVWAWGHAQPHTA